MFGERNPLIVFRSKDVILLDMKGKIVAIVGAPFISTRRIVVTL
jgi:hypothetical protein